MSDELRKKLEGYRSYMGGGVPTVNMFEAFIDELDALKARLSPPAAAEEKKQTRGQRDAEKMVTARDRDGGTFQLRSAVHPHSFVALNHAFKADQYAIPCVVGYIAAAIDAADADARAEERERCAKIAEEHGSKYGGNVANYFLGVQNACETIAGLIRASK